MHFFKTAAVARSVQLRFIHFSYLNLAATSCFNKRCESLLPRQTGLYESVQSESGHFCVFQISPKQIQAFFYKNVIKTTRLKFAQKLRTS